MISSFCDAAMILQYGARSDANFKLAVFHELLADLKSPAPYGDVLDADAYCSPCPLAMKLRGWPTAWPTHPSTLAV